MQVSGKKFLLGLASWLFFSFFCNAQDIQTSSNIINQTGWQGCLTQHNGMIWGGTTGGPCPVQRSADGAILFSYGGSILYQNIAVNQALSGTGIQVRGYQYGWTIKNANAGSNQNPSFDPLTIRVSLYDNTNINIIENKTFDYGRRINDWTRFTGIEDFKNKYSLASVGNVSIDISSRDDGQWKGYYGPEIRDIDVRLRYSVDPCGANPLASPTCEGYQQAFLQQQCAISPLYSQSCPGWQQAWFNQQCSANPLFGSNCPGYAAAYQAQQCSLNQLFSPLCPEYQQAYFTQQCTANPLYNSSCPGYAKALFDKTCNENPLSSTSCPLYESAYLNQQCTSNPLFSTSCPLYQQAYFNQQCTINPLYNSGCPGYADAFRKKQIADACSANPQSNPQCPGYTTAQQITTVTTTTSLPVPSVGNEDVAKLLTTPQVTSDPIVNQALSSNQQSQQLGTGITSRNASPQSLQPQTTQTQQQQRRAAAQQRSQQASQRNAQKDPQDDVMASLSTVPGFSAYEQAKLPDMPFYKAEDIYKRVTIVDNARALRQLNQRSDRIHKEMVDEQYRR
jgi:hypothetical protein